MNLAGWLEMFFWLILVGKKPHEKFLDYQTNITNRKKYFIWFYFQYTHNLGQKTCRLSHVLAQFFFTTSETDVDYYHQKVNLRVALRVVEWLEKKSTKCLDLMASTEPAIREANFDICARKSKKISYKTILAKTYFT